MYNVSESITWETRFEKQITTLNFNYNLHLCIKTGRNIHTKISGNNINALFHILHSIPFLLYQNCYLNWLTNKYVKTVISTKTTQHFVEFCMANTYVTLAKASLSSSDIEYSATHWLLFILDNIKIKTIIINSETSSPITARKVIVKINII